MYVKLLSPPACVEETVRTASFRFRCCPSLLAAIANTMDCSQTELHTPTVLEVEVQDPSAGMVIFLDGRWLPSAVSSRAGRTDKSSLGSLHTGAPIPS